jgi:hypothetical protein
MVGAEGFEPPALCSQSRCATRLRYAPTVLFDCIVNRIVSAFVPRVCCIGNTMRSPLVRMLRFDPVSFDATIKKAHGGYSSVAERLSVAQDVEGSIPSSRPNWQGPEGFHE